MTVTEAEPEFAQWSGMDAVLPSIRVAVGLDEKPRGGRAVNGWAVTAVCCGVDKAAARLEARMSRISLICGLLLSSSLAFAYRPPEPVVREYDSTTSYKALFVLLTTTTVVSHFSCIILSALQSASLAAAARDADRWRIIIGTGMVPSYVDALFTVGNVSLAGLSAVGLYGTLDFVSSVVFAGSVVVFCGAALHWYNTTQLLPLGHPVHGWLNRHPEEFDMALALLPLEKAARHDREKRRNPSEFSARLPASQNQLALL